MSGRLDFVKVLVETRQDELIDEPDDEVPVQLEELDDEVPVQLEEPARARGGHPVSARQLLIILAIVITAVVLQTTLFVDRPDPAVRRLARSHHPRRDRRGQLPRSGIRGYSSASARASLPTSSAVPCSGCGRLSLTVVAYLVVRLRDRVSDSIGYRAAGLFVLTLIGQALFLGMGTLFGQQPLRDPNAVRIAVLTALYTMIVGLGAGYRSSHGPSRPVGPRHRSVVL